MQTILIAIKGNVQGVFFRAFAKTNAEKLNINGYVKNLENNDVEILAQGEEKTLNEFIKILKAGPANSRVIGINHKEISTEKAYKSFSIVY